MKSGKQIFFAGLIIMATSACGKTAEVSVSNPNKSLLQCQTNLAGVKEEFQISDSFTKTTSDHGLLSVACKKQTAGDLSSITAKVSINGDIKISQSSAEEYGIAVATTSM